LVEERGPLRVKLVVLDTIGDVTARTVEGHLTNVFRKLQIDSRDQLPAALAAGIRVPV
jgi:hypothetical protein